jgi:hypothetical protein
LETKVTLTSVRSAARSRMSRITPGQASASTQIFIDSLASSRSGCIVRGHGLDLVPVHDFGEQRHLTE